MKESSKPLTPKETLLLILIPMLTAFVSLRLYLHFMGVRHIYPGGHLVHHLFLGILLVIPAAFLLAFSSGGRPAAIASRVALGTGSAMALDEITYLVMTQASDQDYVSRVSLLGAAVFVALAVILLLAIYFTNRD